MEPTCAACAMEWSIQLEKGLRSGKPGHCQFFHISSLSFLLHFSWFFTESHFFLSGVPVKAILQMGPLLQRWSRELESGIVSNAMFDLVPGEDQLFANTILLRLADAFRGGNTQIRFSVVRVFLIERKHRDNRKHNQCKGLLSMGRVANHVELLKRVKSVFNSGGDSESNALALVLFGCWAEFANSNAQIRYLILSSLVSPHDNEVTLMSCSVATCSCSRCINHSSYFNLMFKVITHYWTGLMIIEYCVVFFI
jgi:integrator complex subunit 7